MPNRIGNIQQIGGSSGGGGGGEIYTLVEKNKLAAVKLPYVHTQVVAAAVWTINHSLGFRPSVQVADGSGNEFYGAVAHPTLNQTTITFSTAETGTATLT